MLRAKLPFFLAYARARQQPIFIDYIESLDRAYINTGLKPSYDYTYKIKYQYTRLSDTFNPIFGTRTGAVTSGNGVFWAGMQWIDKQVYLRFGGDPVNYAMGNSALDIIELTTSPEGIFINGVDTGARYYDGAINANILETYLFALNGNGIPDTSLGNTNARIYSYQVFDGNMNLIQDLRPCLHPETFKACMYDTVTKQYFYNKGTGSFIPAPRFVEYIEFTGTQYIDTGLFPNSNWRIESVCLATVASKNIYSSNEQLKRIFARTAGGTWWFGNSTVGVNNEKLPLNNVNTIVHDKNGVIINGVSYAYDKQVDEFDASSRSLYLGAMNGDLSVSLVGRIYDFKIYDNDVLIQHLKPCLRGNTPCMFDMVTGMYFTNSGTGEFKYSEIKFVDYIRSTGTQWIDTDIEATSITRFVVRGTCDINSASNTQLLGTNDTNATTFFGARYYANTGVKSWYCMNAEGISIGIPTNLSIIDCTIESTTSQYGTLTDLVNNNNTKEFTRLATSEWGFTSGNLLLFGGFGNRISPNAFCYSLQLYTANGLVRDLRPCLDYNNVACMFDMVTGKYFYNQGTGEFIAG